MGNTIQDTLQKKKEEEKETLRSPFYNRIPTIRRINRNSVLHNGTKFKELPTSLNQIPAFVISRNSFHSFPLPDFHRGGVRTSIASMDAYGGIRNCSSILPFDITHNHNAPRVMGRVAITKRATLGDLKKSLAH